MREHLLVEPAGCGFRLSGLFDFEPAMIGHAEYEMASVGLFFSCGDPGLLGRIVQSYRSPVEHSLSRRLLAWMLLHRYSNLPWYMRRMPPPPGIRDLDELAALWFGV